MRLLNATHLEDEQEECLISNFTPILSPKPCCLRISILFKLIIGNEAVDNDISEEVVAFGAIDVVY